MISCPGNPFSRMGRKTRGDKDTTTMSTTTVGKYELGETLGKGHTGMVKFATHVTTRENFAIKIIDKGQINEEGLANQIEREISIMKYVKHPNIVKLHEVMASKSKIYIVMELVSEGDLLDKIINSERRMGENEARMHFQQLIDAIDFCHSRGVYHRDIKPENVLLDSEGNVKVSDFGLSAITQQIREDGLLHTKRGTLAYVAPEVLSGKGYRGETADLWSCGVILFLLLAGHLPFDDENERILYRKILNNNIVCPGWFPTGALRLVHGMLQKDPQNRLTMPQILQDRWFRNGYKPALCDAPTSGDSKVSAKKQVQPVTMSNAFQLISMSEGFNLAELFQDQLLPTMKRQIKLKSKIPAKTIILTIEGAVKHLGFRVQKSEFKMDLKHETTGRKGHLKAATKVFDLASQLSMVEISKADGDTLEFHKFCKDLADGIKDIIWNYDEHSIGIN